jgi:hypothetical protein
MYCSIVRVCIVIALLILVRETVAQTEPLGLAYQLTYSYNVDNAPSPDGGRIVFIRAIEGRAQL